MSQSFITEDNHHFEPLHNIAWVPARSGLSITRLNWVGVTGLHALQANGLSRVAASVIVALSRKNAGDPGVQKTNHGR